MDQETVTEPPPKRPKPRPVVNREGKWVRLDRLYFHADSVTAVNFFAERGSCRTNGAALLIAIDCGGQRLLYRPWKEHEEFVVASLKHLIAFEIKYLADIAAPV